MKSKSISIFTRSIRQSLLGGTIIAMFSLVSLPAHAVDFYWDADGDTTTSTGGSGNWDNTNALWRNSSALGPLEQWVNGNTAVFGGEPGTLATIGAISANRLVVDDSSTGTFAIGTASGNSLEITGDSPKIIVPTGKSLTFTQTGNMRILGTGVVGIEGGGLVTFTGSNRVYAGTFAVTGTGTKALFTSTNALDFGAPSTRLSAGDGGTIEINGTNNYRNIIYLGGAGSTGGHLRVGHISALARQGAVGFNVTGTSQSTIVSTLANTGSTFGGFNLGFNSVNFAVAATGDPSGIDLDFSAGTHNGTLTKTGAGVMRLNAGFPINYNGNGNFTTFNNANTSLNVTAGTFINEGIVKSIAAVSGTGTLKTGTSSGVFDQVNLNGGTFEVSRTSDLFTTGLTFATDKNSINFNGGTLKYVGVNTDYSAITSAFGANGGTIDTNGENVTFASPVTGTGVFRKAGAGTLTLGAANTYVGGFSVDGGVLNLSGFDTTIGSLASGATAGDISLGDKTLTTGTANTDTSYAGSISGSGGSLIKTGTGIQFLTGTHTYDGGTNVNSGILSFGNLAAKPANGTVDVAASAALGLGVSNMAGHFSEADVINLFSGTMVGNLSNVVVTPTTNVAVDTSAGDFTLGTSITSSTRSLIKVGPNVLTLTAANEYSGGTTVLSGTLTFANTLAKPSVGSIEVSAGTTLGLGVADAANYFSSADIDNLFAGTFTDVNNSATSKVGIDTTVGDFIHATNIGASTRGLTKLGNNTLTMSGENAYTGATLVSSGTLRAGIASGDGFGAFGNNSAVTLADGAGATLDLNGFTNQIGSLAGGGSSGGNVLLNGAGLIVGANNANTSYLGSISGAGELTKLGNGTLTLGGDNSHTGGTTVELGSLSATSNTAFGSGTVALQHSTSSTVTTRILLTGGVTIGNNFILNSNARTGFSGSIYANGGGVSTINGSVDVQAAVGNGGNFAAEAGSVLRLMGPINSSTGLAQVSLRIGEIELGNGTGNLTGLLQNEGIVRLAAHDGMQPTVAFTMGASAASTFDLNGFNQTLSNLSKSSFSASVTNTSPTDSTLTINSSADGNFTGTIDDGMGAMLFAKTGSAAFTLGGTNSFTGSTTVSAGTLVVDGSIATSSLTVVQAGATIAGTGTVGPLSVFESGFVNPGTAGTVGTLAVGSSTLAGTYACDLDVSASDRLVVTGDLNLTGAALALNSLALPEANSYLIATYTGTLSGTFSESTPLPSGYALSYATTGQVSLIKSGYQSWATENELDETNNGVLDDSDKDGIPNVLEYVLDGDPTSPSQAILPTQTTTGTDMVFNFTRRLESADDTTQLFEYSPDLVSWTPVNITSPTDAMVTLGTPSGEVQSVTVTIPKGTNTTMFGRLRVSQP